ncbi:MAG: nucleotidyltransferase domain-containing protein [Nitrospirae bacterium]|nr:nucleotidyltransferase domain-containing protein [Nitrospirota bacterium]MBF0534797.1 nucleotidyltransferase domain-containing protein [Nitrospirota bacterium]MBF0616471.1 nucleotidyltransferase domain-containing protein [Nitrospirota bacterium]
MIKGLDKTEGMVCSEGIPSPLANAVRTIVQVARPDKIILFGSYTAGTNNAGSDYDLLVLKKNLKNQRKLVQNIYLHFRNIGAPVDVLALDLDRFAELKDDPYLIYYEADKNGKVIYEKYHESKGMA